MPTKARIAVLASGAGSTMEAIANACDSGALNAEICLLLCNRRGAGALALAAARGIPHVCVPHSDYADRGSFEVQLLKQLHRVAPDIVVLAGFMRILTDKFIREYYGSLLNIHPSLLPKYTGLNTHQRALDAGDAVAGSTVHFVVPELDAGPIVKQVCVPIESGDTASSLAARVKAEEKQMYPEAIKLCLEGKVRLPEGRSWNHVPTRYSSKSSDSENAPSKDRAGATSGSASPAGDKARTRAASPKDTR